ncbi:MAG TPA: hypothetical protein VM261_19100 [Kofleriaceae bacterium]|nr:hypothetical protein [Kofleriaceae bacterium]
MLRFAFLASLSGALLSCGGDSGSNDPDAITLDGSPDSSTVRERSGSVEVTEDRWVHTADAGGGETQSGQIGARFYDGREPSYHREAMRSGDCALKTYENASCTPACTTGVCVDTNVCEPFPTYVSAGRLTLTGLRTAVQIDPMQNWYYPTSQLPNELFADDATVTASLAGATLPAMSITTQGVRPIAPAITGGKLVVDYPATADTVVTWTPSGGDERVKLTLNANNRGHGQPYVAIVECDVADAAGRIAIAPAIMNAFPETDAWYICAGTDCPPSRLTRYRRGATLVGEREVDLLVQSTFTFGIEHHLE